MMHSVGSAVDGQQLVSRAFLLPQNWNLIIIHITVNTSPFWYTLAQYIYSHDSRMWESLNQTWFNGGTSDRFVTREHFHLARKIVCTVCVAYSRRLSLALSGATSCTQYIGYISVCKHHDHHGFCGVCLKDDNVLKTEPPDYHSSLSPVDDFDSYFENITHTCEKCRRIATRQAMKRLGLNNLMAQQTDME